MTATATPAIAAVTVPAYIVVIVVAAATLFPCDFWGLCALCVGLH